MVRVLELLLSLAQLAKDTKMSEVAKQEWIDIAVAALEKAYVPYSHFPVGACLVTDTEKTYQGVNIENASFGLTNCAERTAFFKAVSEGEKQFSHLVIAGHTPEPISPCGACRQVMAEFCSPEMPVTLVDDDGVTKTMTVRELLPYAFTEKDL